MSAPFVAAGVASTKNAPSTVIPSCPAACGDLATGKISAADAVKLKRVLNEIYGNLTTPEAEEPRSSESTV